MPKLNLLAPVMLGADDAEASQGALEITNGYVDSSYGKPTLKKRPGLELLHDLGGEARVDTYWWEAKRILVAVCARKVYAKISIAATPVDITPTISTHAPDFGVKVMFAADEYGVTLTTGRYMLWWGGDTAVPAVRISDPNAPTQISSLAYLKGYMLASIPNTQTFQWALYAPTDDRTQPPPWNPLSLSASAAPDDIICMAAGWEELFILGRESAQSHYASGDSTVPFPALSGSVAETGTVNANTLQKLGNAWIYFTPNYQVVRVEGRVPVIISQAVEHAFRKLEYFDEAEAFILFDRFYALTFRRDDATFVYDLNTGLWYRWGLWDDEVIKYREFKGLSSTYAKAWGMQIMGGATGEIYEMKYGYDTDDEDMIRVMLRSAHVDHGTTHRKFANNLQMRLRVGDYVPVIGGYTDPVFGVDWEEQAKIPISPTDILYASDGFIYLTAGARIYRTDSEFSTYTEMTLDGTVVGTSFGTLVEASNGRIVTADNRYLWVMTAGTTTFTRTAYANSFRYWPGGYSVSGLGDNSPIVMIHGTSGLGSRSTVDVYNLDTGVGLGHFSTAVGGLAATKCHPGILADNGTCVIAAAGDDNLHVFLWRSDNTNTRVLLSADPENPNYLPAITKDPDTGDLYVALFVDDGVGVCSWKSTDDGETWTRISTALLSGMHPTQLHYLFGSECLVSTGDDIYRSDDGVVTSTFEKDLDGTVTRLRRSDNYQIAVLTSGTTTNLYTLQGTPPEPIYTAATGRKMLIRWRDDGRGRWSNYREVSLGEVGEHNLVRRLKGLGCYRTRQYEIVFSGLGPVTLSDIEEDVILGAYNAG